MKILKYYLIYFSIVFSSCILLPIDYVNLANITIENKTNFNLIVDMDYMYHGNKIFIKKGESFKFEMGRIGGRSSFPPNPNIEITTFIFVNADTNETIKETANNLYFERINYNKHNQHNSDYIFIITDDLLFLE
ncbi:MAG: hypothetical protein LBQ82_05745 [Treponema sp.]|jgi:hypothetical protein|nr:hypothetical protein [Treponema sp.]